MNHVNSNYHKSKLQKSQTTYTQMENWRSGVAACVSDVYHERNVSVQTWSLNASLCKSNNMTWEEHIHQSLHGTWAT